MQDSSAEATGAPIEGGPRSIILVRHGPIDDGGNCYGARRNPPLAASAADRVAELGKRLTRPLGPAIVSPAGRTRETAQMLGIEDPVIDERWLERDFGDWEGRPWAECWQEAGDNLAAEGFAAFTPAGGEPWIDVQKRVGEALDELASSEVTTSGPPPIVVTHGGVIRAAMAHVLGIDIATALLFDPAPASATWLTHWGDTWTVAKMGA